MPFYTDSTTESYENFYALPLIWMDYDGCLDPAAPTKDDILVTHAVEGSPDMKTESAMGASLDNNLVSVKWNTAGDQLIFAP